MTRDDITRMAREAGGEDGWGAGHKRKDPELHPEEFVFTPEELERFAALVAAAEREACAQVAERMLRFYTQAVTGVPEAIRARSLPELTAAIPSAKNIEANVSPAEGSLQLPLF